MERLINTSRGSLFQTLFLKVQSTLFPAIWDPYLKHGIDHEDPVADRLLPDVLRILFSVRYGVRRRKRKIRGRPRLPRPLLWFDRVVQLADLLFPHLQDERESNPPAPNPFVRRSPSPGSGNGYPMPGTMPQMPLRALGLEPPNGALPPSSRYQQILASAGLAPGPPGHQRPSMWTFEEIDGEGPG